MASTIGRYQANILGDNVDRDFLDAYRRTMRAALDRIDNRGQRAGLAEAIEKAFLAAGLEF